MFMSFPILRKRTRIFRALTVGLFCCLFLFASGRALAQATSFGGNGRRAKDASAGLGIAADAVAERAPPGAAREVQALAPWDGEV